MCLVRTSGCGRRFTRGAQRSVAVLVLLLIAPASLRADWYFSPFIGIKFGGDTTLLQLEPNAANKHKLTYGGSVMWLGRGLFGVEADLAFVPDYFSGDQINTGQPGGPPQYIKAVQSSGLTTLMGNVVVAAPLSWTGLSLRPYASGGVGLVRTRRTLSSDISSTTNLNGFNIGGGAMGFVRPHVGVKWDVRYMRGWGPSDRGDCFGGCRLHLWRATIGLVIDTRAQH